MNPLTVNPAVVLLELHHSPARRTRRRSDRAASAARAARVALQRADVGQIR